MKLLKVIDKPGLHRTVDSGAIVNIQSSEYDKYIRQRNLMLSQKERIEAVENTLVDLRTDFDEVKTMLKQLLDKK
jgi:hypothetical protein